MEMKPIARAGAMPVELRQLTRRPGPRQPGTPGAPAEFTALRMLLRETPYPISLRLQAMLDRIERGQP